MTACMYGKRLVFACVLYTHCWVQCSVLGAKPCAGCSVLCLSVLDAVLGAVLCAGCKALCWVQYSVLVCVGCSALCWLQCPVLNAVPCAECCALC